MSLLEMGVVEGALPEHVNGTSLDITLGDSILYENEKMKPLVVGYREREPLDLSRYNMSEEGGQFHLPPGEFVLASSREIFHLPLNISAEYKLKSSMARIGLQHLNAGWCDAGWNGS